MLSLANLKQRITSIFERIPIEDGYNHPGEQLLKRAIKKAGDDTLTLLLFMILDTTTPSLSAAILRCLGRLPMPDEEWCALVISRSLQSNYIEVRDAAVQAVEAWDNKRILEELKKHTEQVPWLRDYVDRVRTIN